MKISTRKRLQILIHLFFFSIISIATVMGQSGGTVFGVINDGSSGTSLPGATVTIQGMNYGTITDPYGKYTLTNIPAGKVTLVYSYVGYSDELAEIEITSGTTIEKDVNLVMDMQNLGEVVVSAQLLGQTKAINQQLNSDALMNAVSEDKLKDLPDVNAAEAIARVPGIAIQRESGEGQKVMIRGLEPKFSAVTVNGVRMASNSSTDKSVDLSMVSPELLNGIEVYKSPTPDMDGEAVGGTINLVIKKAPKKATFGAKVDGAYSSLNGSFGNYSGSVNASKRFFDDKFGVIAQANMQQVDRSNNLISTSAATAKDELYFRYFQLSNIDEIRKRTGASVNLDYDVGQGNISLYSFYSSTNRNYYKQYENYSPFEYNWVTSGTQEKQIDLDIWSTALRGEHKLGQLLVDWSLSTSVTNNKTPLDASIDFNDDNAYSEYNEQYNEDFEGWISGANKNYNEAYLYRAYSGLNDVSENFSTGFVDLKLPFKMGDNVSGFIKGGGKYTYVARERDYNEFLEPLYYNGGDVVNDAVGRYPHEVVLNDGRIAASTFLNDGIPVDNTVFGGDYPFNSNYNRALVNDWHNIQNAYYTKNRKEDVEDYDLTETIKAGYLMAKFEFGEMFTIIPGFRFEQSDNQYNAVRSALAGLWGDIGGEFTDTTTYQKYNDFLPHLHMTFKPVRWFSLKGSMVKTIARPNYNYVTPRSMIDIGTNNIKAGNPDLEHMESMNYDINASFYNGKYGLFTFGVFYKDLKNIFYQVNGLYFASDSIAEEYGYSGRKGYYLSSYANSPEAKVYGFEVDLQTNLKYMPAPFNGVVMSANFSRLFSETYKYDYFTTDTTYRDPVTGRPITEYEAHEEKRKITIPGQVPYILNLSIGYDYKGFSCRVSGVYQGSFLKSPGKLPITDVYSNKFWRWDAQVKQKINDHFSIYANLTNLNLQREESYYNENEAYPKRIQEYGMIFNLGVQAKF